MLDILNPAIETNRAPLAPMADSCAGEQIGATHLKPWMEKVLVERAAIKGNRLAVRGCTRRAVPGVLAGGKLV